MKTHQEPSLCHPHATSLPTLADHMSIFTERSAGLWHSVRIQTHAQSLYLCECVSMFDDFCGAYTQMMFSILLGSMFSLHAYLRPNEYMTVLDLCGCVCDVRSIAVRIVYRLIPEVLLMYVRA